MLITITDYYKNYTNIFGKNRPNDYLLFVNKMIREKIGDDFLIPNNRQRFIINYEIKKLIDKAMNVRNGKCDNIIYIHSNIKEATANNLMRYLLNTYPVDFDLLMINLDFDIEEDTYNRLNSIDFI
jgi:hypothetical protein